MNHEDSKTINIPLRLCPTCGTNLVYRDSDGELWLRITHDKIVRVSDSNVGGWFGGQGLKLI